MLNTILCTLKKHFYINKFLCAVMIVFNDSIFVLIVIRFEDQCMPDESNNQQMLGKNGKNRCENSRIEMR